MYQISQWIILLKIKMMETKKVLTRENIPTEELTTVVEKLYKGIRLKYTEVYYLDFSVNEETENVEEDSYA